MGREERGPVRSVAVERREAPHPYVTGVRAPSPRRAADRVMVRQGAFADAPGASRRSISLACEGEGKRGKGCARRPKFKCPGGVSVGCPPSLKLRRVISPSKPVFGRRRMAV